MKGGPIVSAIVGAGFTAGMLAILPGSVGAAAAAGVVSFIATNLILKDDDDLTKISLGRNIDITDIVNSSLQLNAKLYSYQKKIDDKEMVVLIRSIYDTSSKIIFAVKKTPAKYQYATKFFNYYLPETVQLITKYDEIENQYMTSEEVANYFDKSKNMLIKIDKAFKKQLSNLYKEDILDSKADMKVFDTMLKSDGIDDNEINIGGNKS
ncbi:MAG: 5-bromo-4-chloroindolyl phosphate hydrolysis family protein [Clostridia bacterium]|nr:5-bromo-4-chloroindolyl phosphate hydrolysis family protein [Clostridia bacterium]